MSTWLITGASRGLGRSLAEAVLADPAGHMLIATARRPEDLTTLTRRYADRVRTVPLDVTDRAAADRAVATAVTEFGRLDVVVNNAGYADSAPVEEMPADVFRAQIEANLFGVVNVTTAALPVFRRQRSGLFLQISSVGGRVGGSPGLGAYQAAKFGVEGFSLVVAAETAPFGVRTVIVEPGGFRTDWGGASMDIAEVGPDYAASVGAMHAYRKQSDGKQPGDPDRAARILLRVAELPDPPQRLLLGSDAAGVTEPAAERWLAETRAWRRVSAAADYGSDADLSDITKLIDAA
ncbi:SDR family NAD(P)-dependent oxidoreductase [Symbioplanes lichenis]|uniref:SDR family NAD(P)-dependent oxidoreductase n=1 Tax=Symbioplanes lichenis TaxID=1629072 RepID=UPI00273A4738|nr:SDR family NAD(P)-dependent oxidoreductase [Actinoplanes lichenis]